MNTEEYLRIQGLPSWISYNIEGLVDSLREGFELSESVPEEEPEPDNNVIIPANSPSLLINEATSRFSDASWFDAIKSRSVILAGLGGIGSYVAFLLGRLSINNLVLYDNDTVEAANLSGQMYTSNDIGSDKVNAIAVMLDRYSMFNRILALSSRFTSQSPAGNIMICGFDNMASRRTFYESWKHHRTSHLLDTEGLKEMLFIDGRLAAEEFQVFCIRGDDEYNMDRYEKEFLFDDSQAEETPCSYKQTSFCANMIGSVIVNLFVNFVANSLDPVIPRDLPFYTMYDASTMFFKTES